MAHNCWDSMQAIQMILLQFHSVRLRIPEEALNLPVPEWRSRKQMELAQNSEAQWSILRTTTP